MLFGKILSLHGLIQSTIIFYNFVDKSEVNKGSTHNYEGLNMEDRLNTRNISHIYTDVRRNSKENTSIYILMILLHCILGLLNIVP